MFAYAATAPAAIQAPPPPSHERHRHRKPRVPPRRRARAPSRNPLHAFLPPPPPVAPPPPAAPPPPVAPPPAPHRDESPATTLDYNVALKKLARRKNALADCMRLVADMRAAGLRPDKYTYSLLLTSCAAARDTETAIAIYHACRRDRVPLDNHILATLLRIAAASKPPRIDVCVRLFRASKAPSRVMCNVMLDAYARMGSVDDCLTTFRYMGNRRIAPDHYTVSALVKAYVIAGRLDEAVAKIDEMFRAGLHIPSPAFGQVIDAFGRRGDMDRAVQLFDMMTLYGVAPTQVTYNILIGACAHVRMVDRAFEIFDEMRHTSGFPGDRYTFHSLMKVCLAVHDGYNVLRLYRDIRAGVFQPNQVSYRLALTAAGIAMDIDAITEVATDMSDAGCVPRDDTAAALVAASIRCSDLEGALAYFGDFVKRGGRVEQFLKGIRASLRLFDNGDGDFEGTCRVVDELERSWRHQRLH